MRFTPARLVPHFLNRLGRNGCIFVRVGSTNRVADPVLIDEMRRYGQPSSYDEQPIPDLNSEALDFRVASELFGNTRKFNLSGNGLFQLGSAYLKGSTSIYV